MIYLGPDLQFGYVYLKLDQNNDGIYVKPPSIAKILAGKKNSMVKPRTPWPETTDTNFRVSYVDTRQRSDSNYGHSEYQLLADNQLLDMVDSVGCPFYVIVYSNIFPCIKPVNPDPTIPRCGVMLAQVQNRFHVKCPDASFYLLTERETGLDLPDQQKINEILNSGIIWIHEDLNDIGPDLEKWDPNQKMPAKTEPQKE